MGKEFEQLDGQTKKCTDCDLCKSMKILLKTLALTVVVAVSAMAQIIFYEDFEDATHSFTIVNGENTNKWLVGSVMGTKSAYISGVNNSACTLHIYKDITFPASQNPYLLAFDRAFLGLSWSGGVSLQVFLIPASVTPIADSRLSVDDMIGEFSFAGNPNIWEKQAISIPGYNTQTTMRLVFSFNKPAWIQGFSVAIDNISVTAISSNIYTEADLQTLAIFVNAGYNLSQEIMLMNNISLTQEHIPIGSASTPFRGVFNGNYKTISDLSVTGGEYAGLFGRIGNTGEIKNINVSGNVTGGSFAGGLAGENRGKITISSSMVNVNAIGSVDNVFAGGLVGRNYGSIENCYAAGDVSSFQTSFLHSYSGGLAGGNYGQIVNSYATGATSILNNTPYSGRGGLVGFNNDDLSNGAAGIIANSYHHTSDGKEEGGGWLGTFGIRKTIEEMKQQHTFVGWDFGNIWEINAKENSGYPYLRNFYENNCDVLDHDWSNWIETIPATEEEHGEETRTCLRNGCEIAPETRQTDKLDPTSIVNAQKSGKEHGILIEKNPVSNTAKMRVVLPKEEKVIEAKITIYDMTGNIVFVGAIAPNRPLIWNLINTAGRNVANGTYLVIAEVKSANGQRYHYSAKLGVKR